MKTKSYDSYNLSIQKRIRAFLSPEEIRALHERKPHKHFLLLARQVGLLVGLGLVGFWVSAWFIWVPAAILQGFVLLSFIILLHEQVHHAIFANRHTRWERFLGILYALPTGICASQFKRWHLDHHGELGSASEDPKRAHLTPKIIKRWYKALYMTPVLFVIYSIASSKEAKGYPGSLRRTIAWERFLAVVLHVALAWVLVSQGGWVVWLRVYIVPLFFAFPFAFTLNRLGQHYHIDPEDPAKWSTLVNSSPFWNWIFVYSNLHLEHHYLVGVPCYNLPALNKLLQPFYRHIGLEPLTYRAILYHWFVRNAVPHTKWDLDQTQKV